MDLSELVGGRLPRISTTRHRTGVTREERRVRMEGKKELKFYLEWSIDGVDEVR